MGVLLLLLSLCEEFSSIIDLLDGCRLRLCGVSIRQTSVAHKPAVTLRIEQHFGYKTRPVFPMTRSINMHSLPAVITQNSQR